MVDPQKFDTKTLDPHARRRTVGRELAMKLLYLQDVRGKGDHAKGREEVEGEIKRFLARENEHAESQEFALELFRGAAATIADLDAHIVKTADNWDISRMELIDRALLRLGTYELLYRHDVPPKAAISEAIELAKKYSTDKSSSFVNGILDKIFQHSPRGESIVTLTVPASPDAKPVSSRRKAIIEVADAAAAAESEAQRAGSPSSRWMTIDVKAD
jgi:transcription antitermination factor NusB